MQREIAIQIDHIQSFAAREKVYEQLVYMIVFSVKEENFKLEVQGPVLRSKWLTPPVCPARRGLLNELGKSGILKWVAIFISNYRANTLCCSSLADSLATGLGAELSSHAQPHRNVGGVAFSSRVQYP
jgi:hypothetical protein